MLLPAASGPADRTWQLLRWTLPEQVPGYDINADAPFLVADQNHTVHAFNSVYVGRDLVVVYSQWTATNGWTAPVDILLTPLKREARLMGVSLDNQNIVHLIFWGGDDLLSNIYYARAPLMKAGEAQSWSPLVIVGEHAITPSIARIIGDGQNRLYVIFSGNRDGTGVYATYSDDSGESWTEPANVYLVPDEVHWPAAFDVTLDDQGRVHAVWSIADVKGNSDAIFHSRLDLDTMVWTEPFMLAARDPGDYEADWASIVYFKGQIIVVYDDSFPATRWMRRSLDGGDTWTDPVLPFSYIGEYRHASFVVDSGGTLHMLLGNRTPQNIHGMWHSIWLGDRWSDLEPIISGPRVVAGPLSTRFDPTAPQAIISQGNVLLVTWSQDPGAGRNGVWSSFTRLNTPELPVVALTAPVEPTPDPQTAQTGFETIVSTQSPPLPMSLAQAHDSKADLPNPALIVMAGFFPALALILGAVAVNRLFFSSRR